MSKITPQNKDFSQWYLDVIKYADLADYSKVKGCMIIKPWGYAIWEFMQSGLNKMIKDAGVQNVYFPLFIPESFINREKEHIEGFAPECAVVTHGGGKPLAENLFVRPTSETIMYDTFSDWIQSYRDLPLKVNQWANVVRWEMRTRPFLRTTEFLWQEGHTAHATKEDADIEAERALQMYVDFDREYLAMPVKTGKKTRKETFAGALYTLCTEALARDGKAIQAGTSHNLGQGFAESFDIKFSDSDGEVKRVWQTSWGVSTRLVGTLIVVHGDDKGLRLPPSLAPHQVVGIPIWKTDEEKTDVLNAFNKIEGELANKLWRKDKVRFHLDDRENQSPGFKFNEWEVKGVPLRIEIGPRDLQAGNCTIVRRDNFEKIVVKIEEAAEKIEKMLDQIQQDLFDRANEYVEENTHFVGDDYEKFKEMVEKGGFFRAYLSDDEDIEKKIQDETKATVRIIEEVIDDESKKCMYSGKKADMQVLMARAY